MREILATRLFDENAHRGFRLCPTLFQRSPTGNSLFAVWPCLRLVHRFCARPQNVANPKLDAHALPHHPPNQTARPNDFRDFPLSRQRAKLGRRMAPPDIPRAKPTLISARLSQRRKGRLLCQSGQSRRSGFATRFFALAFVFSHLGWRICHGRHRELASAPYGFDSRCQSMRKNELNSSTRPEQFASTPARAPKAQGARRCWLPQQIAQAPIPAKAPEPPKSRRHPKPAAQTLEFHFAAPVPKVARRLPNARFPKRESVADKARKIALTAQSARSRRAVPIRATPRNKR